MDHSLITVPGYPTKPTYGENCDCAQVGKLLGLRADRAVIVSDWPLCDLAGELEIDASELVVGNVVKVVRGAKVIGAGAASAAVSAAAAASTATSVVMGGWLM